MGELGLTRGKNAFVNMLGTVSSVKTHEGYMYVDHGVQAAANGSADYAFAVYRTCKSSWDVIQRDLGERG